MICKLLLWCCANNQIVLVLTSYIDQVPQSVWDWTDKCPLLLQLIGNYWLCMFFTMLQWKLVLLHSDILLHLFAKMCCWMLLWDVFWTLKRRSISTWEQAQHRTIATHEWYAMVIWWHPQKPFGTKCMPVGFLLKDGRRKSKLHMNKVVRIKNISQVMYPLLVDPTKILLEHTKSFSSSGRVFLLSNSIRGGGPVP